MKERFDSSYVRFGGRQALARHVACRMFDLAGAYRRYRAIDWGRVRRVVFVCSGNICRSPYAERRFRAWGIPAASAGLRGDAGSKPPPEAVRHARALGVSMEDHAARAFDPGAIVPGDLVAVFEPSQAREVRRLLGARAGVQVTLVGLWGRPAVPYIHDPYALSDAYFLACYERIDAALEAIRERLAAASERGVLAS